MLCSKCFHSWTPRVFSPKNCPKCGASLGGYGGGYTSRCTHNRYTTPTPRFESEPPLNVRLGMKVMRKLGGPVMIVSKICGNGICECTWVDKEKHESAFLTWMLMEVKDL